MSNPLNNGTVIGRVAGDPKVFENKDGSKKVVFALYADHDYTNDQNERGSDIVPLEAFVRASTTGTGPFANVHKGDLVAVQYKLRQERYTKGGQEVFELKALIQEITYLEPKSVTQARLQKRLAEAETANQALQAQNPAPVAQTAPASAVAASEELPFG